MGYKVNGIGGVTCMVRLPGCGVLREGVVGKMEVRNHTLALIIGVIGLHPRSLSLPAILSNQSPATEQPDFINNNQNTHSDQELFLLISLSMDNHNAKRFLHPIHGEDKAAGLPP